MPISDGYAIAGMLGEGLKGFADSYGAEKDRMRKQAEADDERQLRKRGMAREDFTAGVKWDPETSSYSGMEGRGLITKSEKDTLHTLGEGIKNLGENVNQPQYAPLLKQYTALLQKAFGGEAGTPSAPVANVGGLSMPAPQTAPQGSKAPGLMKKPRAKQYNVPPMLARDEQIAQTEALGAIPSVPTAAPAKPAAQPVSPVNPYEEMARQAENAPIPGYDPSKWNPGFIPEKARKIKEENRKRAQDIRFKGMEKSFAPQEKLQGDLAGAVATKASIASSMRQLLTQLDDPKVPEEMKLTAALEGLKTLNSTQGKDALGAEEVKRLAAYLEYQVFNFTGAGEFWGRSVPKFTEQVRNNLGRVEGDIQNTEGLLGRAKRGESLSTPVAPKAGTGPIPKGGLYSPGTTIYIDGTPHRVGADGKTADPL